MSKSISPELQALIDVSVEANKYDSADDLIKSTHTSLEDPETQKAVKNAWLKRQLARADTEGGKHSIEDTFSEIRADLDALNSSV